MNTLKQVKVGQTCTVKRVHGEGALRRRIMDMGITKGVEIYVRKVAPLGDPIEITVRDYELRFVKMMLNLLRLNDRELTLFLEMRVSEN